MVIEMKMISIVSFLPEASFGLWVLSLPASVRLCVQCIGIPMGIDPAPQMANLYLYYYEPSFMETITKENYGIAKKFNNTSRFIDDLAMLNNDGFLQQFKERIFPKELVLNQENKEDNRATFLDLEAHIKDGKFCTKTYDKREALNFEIVNYPDLSGNIPERPAYGIYISQVIRYAKICNQTNDFIDRIRLLFNKLRKNISPRNGCWQPWRNVARRTLGLWINTAIEWTIIWPMIVGALIHEAGTVIQAPKPVCQFMAEDIPPPVLNPYPTTSINSTSHKVPSQLSSQD